MKTAIPAALAAACVLAPVGASAMDFSVAPRVSTLGYGLELGVGGEYFRGRLAHTQMSRDENETYEGIEYDLELDWANTAALLDWHVFGGGFRLTAGITNNGNDFVGVAPPDTYNIGGTDYTVGLQAELDFDSAAPYVGLGWASRGQGFGFGFDLGVVYQGSPGVTLIPSGPPSVINDPTFQADLERERQAVEDDISEYDLYPVVALTLSYTF